LAAEEHEHGLEGLYGGIALAAGYFTF